MVNQAGIEVLIFILWIVFSVYSSIQQKKKKEMKKTAPGRPTVDAEPQEDPFKKIFEELLGKQEEPLPAPVKKTISQPTLSEVNKPVYESIPADYKGAQGSMPDSTTLSSDYSSTIDNYYSIEGKYETPHFLTPEEEGISTTVTVSKETVKRKKKPNYGMLINGRRVSMRDAVVAQILLEKRI